MPGRVYTLPHLRMRLTSVVFPGWLTARRPSGDVPSVWFALARGGPASGRAAPSCLCSGAAPSARHPFGLAGFRVS